MYSVILMAAFSTAPDGVDCRPVRNAVAHRREVRAHYAPARAYVVVQQSAGCVGTVSKPPTGKQSLQVAPGVAPLYFAAPVYRTPVRSFLNCPNGVCARP